MQTNKGGKSVKIFEPHRSYEMFIEYLLGCKKCSEELRFEEPFRRRLDNSRWHLVSEIHDGFKIEMSGNRIAP